MLVCLTCIHTHSRSVSLHLHLREKEGGRRVRCAWGCSEADSTYCHPVLSSCTPQQPRGEGPRLSEGTPGATVLASEGSGRGATIATGIRGHTEDSPERPDMLSGEREVCESQVQGKEGEGRTRTPWRGDGADCHPTLGLGLPLAPPPPHLRAPWQWSPPPTRYPGGFDSMSGRSGACAHSRGESPPQYLQELEDGLQACGVGDKELR